MSNRFRWQETLPECFSWRFSLITWVKNDSRPTNLEHLRLARSELAHPSRHSAYVVIHQFERRARHFGRMLFPRITGLKREFIFSEPIFFHSQTNWLARPPGKRPWFTVVADWPHETVRSVRIDFFLLDVYCTEKHSAAYDLLFDASILRDATDLCGQHLASFNRRHCLHGQSTVADKGVRSSDFGLQT